MAEARLPGTEESGVQWGWTVGDGVERAIAPRWTLKAEYGFLSFGDEGFTRQACSNSIPPRGNFGLCA